MLDDFFSSRSLYYIVSFGINILTTLGLLIKGINKNLKKGKGKGVTTHLRGSFSSFILICTKGIHCASIGVKQTDCLAYEQ